MRKAFLLPRGSGKGLLALIAALSLLLMASVSVLASTVRVYDFANVLNASQVKSAASSLPYGMDIYTTTSFTGSKSLFSSQTSGKISGSNQVVMAIDVRNHYVYLDGRGVSLSRNQYQDAANAFSSNFHSNDYTTATLAAIDSLRNNSSSGASAYMPGGSSFGLGGLCCVGLLVLAALVVFGVMRGRRRGGGFFNQGGQNYNQPGYQNSYPPNYQGPNYGPGYQQNQGMNPLAAGGLGAAAGGLLGYELGKEQGEREEYRNDQGNYGNYGGDGGAGADFGGGGGGAGADFGGGDSGGGAGADFEGGGGGGDFGGGGGGGGDF